MANTLTLLYEASLKPFGLYFRTVVQQPGMEVESTSEPEVSEPDSNDPDAEPDKVWIKDMDDDDEDEE